jgi:hypothetical protein
LTSDAAEIWPSLLSEGLEIIMELDANCLAIYPSKVMLENENRDPKQSLLLHLENSISVITIREPRLS